MRREQIAHLHEHGRKLVALCGTRAVLDCEVLIPTFVCSYGGTYRYVRVYASLRASARERAQPSDTAFIHVVLGMVGDGTKPLM